MGWAYGGRSSPLGDNEVKEESVLEPARSIPVSHRADVVVAGGGTAGVAAAVSAARLGLSVVMIERSAIPGGMVTHVTQWLNDFENKGGFAREFLGAIEKAGICDYPYYNPFRVVPYFDELIEKAGVRPLYLAMAVAPLVEEGRIAGVVMESKSGRTALRAKIIIDATGDGDIAARAGAKVRVGRSSDGACQAVTLPHMVNNYQGGRIEAAGLNELAARAGDKAGTGYRLPYDSWSVSPLVKTASTIMPPESHATGFDCLSADGLSDCLIELRRQCVEFFETLKNNAEKFGEIEFGPFGAIPGIRESRRIVCDKTIAYEDVKRGVRRDDGLFLVTQAIDIHRRAEGEPAIIVETVKPYHVPYGALLPKGIENLLVVGRCISGDHEALASYRIIADCFAMGEAAAIAANLAIENRCGLREIPAPLLIKEMQKRGYVR